MTPARRRTFAALTAWMHVVGVSWTMRTAGPDLALAVLTLPGLVTTIAVPMSRRRSWRWLVLSALVLTTKAEFQGFVLLVGESWLLHRVWFVERPAPGQAPRARRRNDAGLRRFDATGS